MKATETTTNDIKFNLHNIASKSTGKKVKVHYSLDNNVNHPLCVTIYAKDYLYGLSEIFSEGVKNDTDSQTDYFENDRMNLTPSHPLYQAARDAANRAEANNQKLYAKQAARRAAKLAA